MITIRILKPTDAEAFRTVRLRALAEHPEAFASSVEETEWMTLEQFAQRLTGDAADNVTFGAWNDDALCGMVNIHRESPIKTRHRMHVGGMYVVPQVRGQGVGRQLIQAMIDHARSLSDVDHIILAVTVGNDAARRLYSQAGFVSWGIDPRYIRLEDTYYDIEWMVLHLGNK